MNGTIDEILCEQYDKTVGKDNCVRFRNHVLQIPKDQYRCHYVKAKVRVHCYAGGQMAIFHDSRKLAEYDAKGSIKTPSGEEIAA